MVKCQVCGKDELLSFECRYCGNNLCGEHRLPENHYCKVRLVRKNMSKTSSWKLWDI